MYTNGLRWVLLFGVFLVGAGFSTELFAETSPTNLPQVRSAFRNPRTGEMIVQLDFAGDFRKSGQYYFADGKLTKLGSSMSGSSFLYKGEFRTVEGSLSFENYDFGPSQILIDGSILSVKCGADYREQQMFHVPVGSAVVGQLERALRQGAVATADPNLDRHGELFKMTDQDYYVYTARNDNVTRVSFGTPGKMKSVEIPNPKFVHRHMPESIEYVSDEVKVTTPYYGRGEATLEVEGKKFPLYHFGADETAWAKVKSLGIAEHARKAPSPCDPLVTKKDKPDYLPKFTDAEYELYKANERQKYLRQEINRAGRDRGPVFVVNGEPKLRRASVAGAAANSNSATHAGIPAFPGVQRTGDRELAGEPTYADADHCFCK